MEIEFSDDEDDNIIQSSQKEECCEISPMKSDEIERKRESKLPDNHDSIAEIMRMIDGDIESSTVERSKDSSTDEKVQNRAKEETLVIINEVKGSVVVTEKEEESLRTNASKVARMSITKSRITDYFCKVDKP